MRLYRGKRVDGKGWVVGNYYYDFDEQKHFIKAVLHDSGDGIENPPCDYQKDFEVIPETVGQSTGLKDKNGVEIFEGDIVKRYTTEPETFTHKVSWSEFFAEWTLDTVGIKIVVDSPYYQPEPSDYAMTSVKMNKKNGLEVIGNIHDNPELKEQVK